MDWNDLRVFLAVANNGTLSAAASELGVSPSTVSRRIEMLEAALGLRLFKPHRDGYDLTEDGRSLVPSAERAASQILLFERDAVGTTSKVFTIRIEAPELLSQEILLPALAPVLSDHPELRIDLRGSVRPVQIVHEEADIILRLVRPDKGNYRMKRLGQLRFGLYASADYARHAGVPDTTEDLRRHRMIGWPAEFGYLLMARWLSTTCPEATPQLHLATLSAHLAAAKAGMGWAVLPEFSAQPYGLVRALPSHALTADLWLLTRIASEPSIAAQRCVDALQRALRPILIKPIAE